MNRIRRWNRWRFAAAAVLLAAAPVAAQEYRGNLFVEVKDELGNLSRRYATFLAE